MLTLIFLSCVRLSQQKLELGWSGGADVAIHSKSFAPKSYMILRNFFHEQQEKNLSIKEANYREAKKNRNRRHQKFLRIDAARSKQISSVRVPRSRAAINS